MFTQKVAFSWGFVITDGRLENWSKEDQEDLYKKFYSALLVAEDRGDVRLLIKYSLFLSQLHKLWELSQVEVIYWQNKVIDTRILSQTMIESEHCYDDKSVNFH